MGMDMSGEALCDALVADLDAGFADVVRAHERVVHSGAAPAPVEVSVVEGRNKEAG